MSPVIMFWNYRVPDWTAWEAAQRVFNEQDPGARERRQKYGMLRRWVYRSVDDPKEVMLVAEFRSRQGAEALLRDPEGMRSWHERTGLEVFPPVLIMEELRHLAFEASKA